jgi:hypothetical protein
MSKEDNNVVLEESMNSLILVDLRILSYHYSFCLVSCFEEFWKDVFIECLKIKPEKTGNSFFWKITVTTNKLIRSK